jgi:hypothetical protein
MSTKARKIVAQNRPLDADDLVGARDQDDVEGHSFLNPGLAQDLARAREREMQQKAARHRIEEEARRPLRK